ncbi:hypothetical protein Gotri_012339, partial [Gossypium trilobum]|nr:hypothetical protein [Gossypium trilobum]
MSGDATRKNQNWWLDSTIAIMGAILISIFTSSSAILHVKVPLVVYATIEMHKNDRVLRQFGFRQSIPMAPQDLGDMHPINLWR